MPDVTNVRERSWAALALSVGGLMLLMSLYLPWRTESCRLDEYFGNQGGTVSGLLHLFSGSETKDGLSTELGRVSALFALLLVALGAAAWARPGLARRLPLGTCALLAGFFGLAVGVEVRSDPYSQGCDSHYDYGAYAGLVATIVVLAAATLARRAKLARYLSASRLVMLVLVGGLVGTFLLPWWEQTAGPTDITWIGVTNPAAIIAAALALCLPAIWVGAGTTPAERLGLATAIALFTGAAASSAEDVFVARAYGVWLALGLVGGLLALALVKARRGLRVREASWHQLATAAAGGLFLAALFLPWQRWCYGAGFGPLSRHCFTMSAWTARTWAAAAAAGLAIALVLATVKPRRVPLSLLELAVAFALLVTTVGFELEEGGGDGFRIEHAYGSTIGFILAGALIALALVRVRLTRFDWWRVPARLVPIAACAAYLLIVVLPWWILNPDDGRWNISFPALTWLTIAGALLGIHLLGRWIRQIAGAAGGPELVLLPVALLGLAAVDLINQREAALDRGGGAVVGLCLLLVVLGRIEQRGGLERFRIPNALRLDRL
jgi:hypothetical protein